MCSEISCGDCLFRTANRGSNGLLQRYLDHRWPKKVAVHCPTQELWDEVQEKMFTEGRKWAGGSPEKEEYPGHPYCISIEKNGRLMKGSVDIQKAEGFKIITAAEFLDLDLMPGPADYVAKLLDEDITLTTEQGMFKVRALGIPPYTSTIESEDTMSKDTVAIYITRIYENLEDAVLVDKHFGPILSGLFDSFTRTLWLTDKKDAYLEEAKIREAAQKKAAGK